MTGSLMVLVELPGLFSELLGHGYYNEGLLLLWDCA